MHKKLLVICLLLFPLASYAGHAEPDWVEPVEEYYTGQILFDRLELSRSDNEENTAVWDLMAWYGGDYHRLVIKSEGENTQDDGAATHLESAEILYSYLISPFWSLQGGIGTRGELSSANSMENYAVISLMGLAPYWFEMDNSLIINEEGDAQFVIEAEYEWLLTQTSYLQPRLELVGNIGDSEAYQRESGLSNMRVGLRYRQEVTREFAPYVGIYWSRALGNTANQMEANGEDTTESGIVIGARVWF